MIDSSDSGQGERQRPPRLEFPLLQAFPSPRELYRHPITTTVAVAALTVTAASFAGVDVSPLYFDRRFVIQPWRLVTSDLPHVDIVHLAFNVYWFWLFGTAIEGMLGWWRYLAVIVAVAIGSAAAEHALFIGGVGLSGVGYALFGLLWVSRASDARAHALLPPSTVRLFVVWFFLCLVLTGTGILPIANVAHGIGAVLGVLFGYVRRTERWRRRALIIDAGLIVVVSLVGALSRPLLNLWPERAAAIDGDGGYAALSNNRHLEAAVLLDEAVKLDSSVPANWINFGTALHRLGRSSLALDAYERALALDPGDREVRRSIADVYSYVGHGAQAKGHHKDAIRFLRRAVELKSDDRAAWQGLAVSLEHIGASDEADSARRRAERAGAP